MRNIVLCIWKLLWVNILQARFQQYVNHKLPDVQTGFRKGRGSREQIANIHWIIEKQDRSGKTSTFTLLTMPMPLTVWITTNWKILREMGIPDHLTCLLRNLYADQEATVRTRPGTTDWFQIGKGVHQGCILSPRLFNLYLEYMMQNAGLDEAQAGIKIARRSFELWCWRTLLSLLDSKEIQQVNPKWILNIHWKDWCWSWNSNTLATWCKELTHWERPWWQQRLKAAGEGNDRGWGGWMASLMWWAWFWGSAGSWWWTGKLGVLHSMGSQRVWLDWVTELKILVLNLCLCCLFSICSICSFPPFYSSMLSFGLI